MKRLAIVLLLNLTLIGGLVIVGLSAGSVGVMATGVDYLADASAIGISLLAIRHGHAKSMNLAALINATFLLCLNLGVISAAIERLVTGVPEQHVRAGVAVRNREDIEGIDLVPIDGQPGERPEQGLFEQPAIALGDRHRASVGQGARISRRWR